MIDNQLYHKRAKSLEGMSLAALWDVSCPDEEIWNNDYPFDKKKKYFFALLQRFMQEGKIRLANHGKFLEGSIEEQIQRFKEVFPEKEEDLYYGLWFTFDECPGGAVWVLDDGTLDWT